MPFPLAALGIASAIPGLLQTGLGLFQGIKGANMDITRPVMDTPEAKKETTAMARLMALNQRMPGMSAAENRVMQGSSNFQQSAKDAAGSSAELMAGLVANQQNENANLADLGAKNASFQQNNMMNLQNQLEKDAQYQRENFNWNKVNKFQEDTATKSALIGSGIQNTFGGVDSLAKIGGMGSILKDVLGGFGQRSQERQAADFFSMLQNMGGLNLR
jgi:hypothetical protein